MGNLLSDDELNALTKTEKVSDIVKKPIGLLYLQQLLQKDDAWWEALHEQIANTLNHHLNQQNFSSRFEYCGIGLRKYSDWLVSQSNPTVLQAFSARPLPGNFLFAISADCIFQLVESFFGGGEAGITNIRRQEFTLIELRLINRLMPEFIKAFSSIWRLYTDIDCELENVEYCPQDFCTHMPDDYVFIANFKLEVGNAGFDLVIPHPVMPFVRQQYMGKAKLGIEATSSQNMQNNIMELPIELRSVVSESNCNLQEVLRLVRGDLLPVEMADNVIIKVESEPTFEAQYARNDNATQCKIIRALVK